MQYDFCNSNLKCDSEFAKTFQNQVISICLNPNLMDSQNMIPEAKVKALTYIDMKVGAYSCAKGNEKIRSNMAKFLTDRDGHEADKDEIFLLYGGIDAYHHIAGLIFNQNDGVTILLILGFNAVSLLPFISCF